MIRLLTAGPVVVLVTALTGYAGNGTTHSGQPSPTTAHPGPAPQPPGSVSIADEGGNSLTVLDASTNKVAATLMGLSEPHNVQVSRDGSVVYAVSGNTDSGE